jgi:hypothetical protein
VRGAFENVGPPWQLVVLGCGTVGYAVVRELGAGAAMEGLGRLILCDAAAIRPHNALTCPEYEGHVGEAKCDRLAELARDWLPGVAVETIHGRVQQIVWEDTLDEAHDGLIGRTFVVAGLDCWTSRMIVAEDLRHHVARTGADVVHLQVGLDRDACQVCVYGTGWGDPCPACGIGALPATEPCIAYAGEGLLRGDLRLEAGTAGRLVRRIIRDELGSPAARGYWINTKTNLRADPPGGKRYVPLTRAARARPGCRGPHGPETPMRADRVLEPLSLYEEGSR